MIVRQLKHAVLLFCCLVLLLAGLTASVPKAANAVNPQVVKAPELAVFYKQGKKTYILRMGMLKQEVDKLIGQPKAKKMPTGDEYYEYGDMAADYLDGRLAMITLDAHAYLSGGIKLQMPVSEALRKRGETSLKNKAVYHYRWEKKSNKAVLLKGAKEVSKYKGRADVYELSISSNILGTITGISIDRSDYRAKLMANLGDDSPAPSIADKPLSMDDFSLVSKDGDKKIKLGMTRAQIEKLLGEKDDWTVFGDVYDGIKIKFRDEKAAMFILTDNSDFSTPRGLGIWTSITKLNEVYGQPTSEGNGSINYHFFMGDKKNASRVLKLSELQSDLDRNKIYVISVNTAETDNGQRVIDFLLIGDWNMSMNGK